MTDKDGYPDEKELKTIQEWDVIGEANEISDLLAYLEELWRWPDSGFSLEGKTLELHTGGWSGNEDIIIALEQNRLFWSLYWKKSVRGGHYYFDLRDQRGNA